MLARHLYFLLTLPNHKIAAKPPTHFG